MALKVIEIDLQILSRRVVVGSPLAPLLENLYISNFVRLNLHILKPSLLQTPFSLKRKSIPLKFELERLDCIYK